MIRDKRRIDRMTGAVRAPAGEQPAGTPPARPAAAGQQMSEQRDAGRRPAAAERRGDGGDLSCSWPSAPRTCSGSPPSTPTTASGSTGTGSLVVDQAAERFALRPAPDPRRHRAGPRARRPDRRVQGRRRPRPRACSTGSGVERVRRGRRAFDPALHEAVMHDTSAEVDRADRDDGAAAGLPPRRPGAAAGDGGGRPTRRHPAARPAEPAPRPRRRRGADGVRARPQREGDAR